MTIKFTGLHAHTGFSTFDGLSQPKDHFDFVIKNGANSLAITEHGHMNSMVYAYLAAKELNKKGIKFKYIPGCEMYIHPDLKQWKIDYELNENNKNSKKKTKVVVEGEDETATIENEEETKSNKYNDPIKKRNHLVVLAKSSKGLNNLFSLVSRGYKDGFYKFPRIDYSLLKKYGEDLIVSSACCGGNLSADVFQEFPGMSFDDLVPSLVDDKLKMDNILKRLENTLDKVVDAVGIENTFIELQFNKLSAQHLANRCFLELAKKTGIKLISTADSHYPNPDLWQDRELYKKLGWISYNKDLGKLPESIDELKAELYPKNGDQMWNSYKETTKNYDFYDDNIVLESIKLTDEIAFQLIGDVKPDTEVKLPSWVISKGEDPFEKLKQMAFDGLKNRGFDANQEYIDRLNSELQLIKDKKLEKYFLMQKEIISIAEKLTLIGAGRGSAAGSLLCFCLGLTNLNPIKYNLSFYRFINPYRKGLPDIDTDFGDRNLVVDALKQKFGDENVINISNINTLKLKSLIKDVSKFYEIPFMEVNNVTKVIDQDVAQGSQAELGDKIINPSFDEAIKYCKPFANFIEQYPIIANHIKVLYKQVKTVGKHAGGVIISENILDRMPVITSKNTLQTPWSESGLITHLEEMGWIKFDLLGVETLDTIQNCISFILKNEKGIKNPTFSDIKKWYDENLDPNVLDLNDQHVYKHIYHEGRFAGIFQFTETGAQNFIKKIKPTCIDDISACTSIFRPGPLKGNVDKVYIENKEDAANIVYEHPLIKKVLENTYNCLIFQEQAMALANVAGSIPLEDCDDLRRVISKKPDPGSEMEKKVFSLEEQFVAGAIKNGIKEAIAKDLFDKMKKFSKYSFNASHSYSYSILSYQSAWLMTYYEKYWLCAFLNKEPEERKAQAIGISKSQGYEIETVNINTSSGTSWEVSEDGKSLIQPLNYIKGLGEKAIEQIIQHRPFNKIEDLLFNDKIIYSKLNKKAIDVLIRSNACKNLQDYRFKNTKHFWLACAFERPKAPKNLVKNIEEYKTESDFSNEEKINNIIDLTGVFPLGMVVDEKVLYRIQSKGIPGISNFDQDLMVCWFIPRSMEWKKTKTGKDYLILKVIDQDCKAFPIKCWGAQKTDVIHINRPYVGKLKYDVQWGFSVRGINKNFKLIG